MRCILIQRGENIQLNAPIIKLHASFTKHCCFFLFVFVYLFLFVFFVLFFFGFCVTDDSYALHFNSTGWKYTIDSRTHRLPSKEQTTYSGTRDIFPFSNSTSRAPPIATLRCSCIMTELFLLCLCSFLLLLLILLLLLLFCVCVATLKYFESSDGVVIFLHERDTNRE